jgi:hypothetical protein
MAESERWLGGDTNTNPAIAKQRSRSVFLHVLARSVGRIVIHYDGLERTRRLLGETVQDPSDPVASVQRTNDNGNSWTHLDYNLWS